MNYRQANENRDARATQWKDPKNATTAKTRRCGAVSRQFRTFVPERWFVETGAIYVRPAGPHAGQRLSAQRPVSRVERARSSHGGRAFRAQRGLDAARSWRREWMATEGEPKTDVERIMEMIRLLNLALDRCNKLLAQAEDSVQASGQDNEPRLKDSSV